MKTESKAKLTIEAVIHNRRRVSPIRSPLTEGTDYLPRPGSESTYAQLAQLTLKKDGAYLLVKDRYESKPRPVQKDGVVEPLDCEKLYALTTKRCHVWVSFYQNGDVHYAETYGTSQYHSDTDFLLGLLGEMVSEHEDDYYTIADAPERIDDLRSELESDLDDKSADG